ncbi:BadF/BadG/BcrA/BcrD ATPase family protein [Desulfosporosinus sp. PR]|uniref:BadF/BadG/BcrA/BcrD ATPase family protein n=1 Tax=Candidatus Desulfosporosinus nitrosoreducens TaxID=3401928 RepID=UPI0027EDE4D8|nr:BadF/BadG/BcrA/BcrD ATPase family protein [Desulfosporosinus sp. PR]MDQ7093436.1 BadF/BadG/BcrA/BcrD ATPase family protein [Desulfosporosinus sp. PR]
MGVKIGVDGGGSKTEIVALDASGQVLCSQRNPSSNYHVVGMMQAVRSIVSGIQDCFKEEPLEGIGISLAGIDTAEDWNIMANGIRAALVSVEQERGTSFRNLPIVLENDAFGALMSVRGTFSGNVLAVGTGTVALGVNRAGKACRVGGWGHLIGDQGSGYDIGRKALVAMIASFDGYGPKSVLESLITQHLRLNQVREIVDWLNQANRTNKDVAALVPVVVEAAGGGDSAAQTILQEAGRDLGLLTLALLRQTQGQELGLVGGIVHIWEFIKPSFQLTIEEEFPALQFLTPCYPPSVGAALLSEIAQVRHIEF